MKRLLLAAIASLFFMEGECFTEAEEKMMYAIHEGCMPQSGATNEMAQRALVGDFPEDDAFKKHMLCMSKAFGFIDQSGNLRMDFINSELDKRVKDPGLKAEIVTKCVIDKGSPEETAFHSSKCMYAYKDSFN